MSPYILCKIIKRDSVKLINSELVWNWTKSHCIGGRRSRLEASGVSTDSWFQYFHI